MSTTAENFEAAGEYWARNGHPAWCMGCQIPKAEGASREDLVGIWTAEYEADGETWGLANNGSGQDRLWRGPLYLLDDERTVAVEHPAGTHVVQVDQQALAVAKPDGIELFCDRDTTTIWEEAVLRALREWLVSLGVEMPPFEETFRERGDAA